MASGFENAQEHLNLSFTSVRVRYCDPTEDLEVVPINSALICTGSSLESYRLGVTRVRPRAISSLWPLELRILKSSSIGGVS